MDNTKKNNKKNMNSYMNIIKGGDNEGLYIFLVIFSIILFTCGLLFVFKDYLPENIKNLIEQIEDYF